MQSGDTAAAVDPLREAVASYTVTLGAEHGWTADAESVLGGALTSTGQFAEAEQFLLSGYQKLRAAGDPDGPFTRQAADRLVGYYERVGRPAEAERYR